MNGYRIASKKDLPQIIASLCEGREGEILTKSLCSADDPRPLPNLCRGPFSFSGDEVSGFSPDGDEKRAIRLVTSRSHHYIEVRKGEGDWIPPELGSVVLLVHE